MSWENINNDSKITAIHAALLPIEPDGVILYFGDWTGVGEEIGVQNVTYSRLYRMAPGLDDPIVPLPENVPDTDAFCCGQAFLADGRLLVAGGTIGWRGEHGGIHEPHYAGERACWIYLPRDMRWSRVRDMNFQPEGGLKGGGRWYPTLVTLGSGEVFTAGGHPDDDDFYPLMGDQRHNNNTPERYSAGVGGVDGVGKWTLMTADITAPPGVPTDSYPRYHLLPNGMLFSDTAGKGGNQRELNAETGVWTGPNIGNLGGLPSFYDRGSEATSVLLPLLPPHYRARVLACNSGHMTAFRIDINDNRTWEQTSQRQGPAAGRSRDNACATLLPTGQVLVTGGWPGNYPADDPELATLQPELYTPGINWVNGDFSNSADEDWDTINDPAPSRRGYHSTALLLPDGRVWHGGSTTEGDGPNRTIDVFAPDYVGVPNRPTITDSPANVGYAMGFPVQTPQANTIARAALIRCGSITHGFNSDQRYVGLNFDATSNNTLFVISPPSPSIAPPGYYMLFLVDNQDRVCQRARFVRLSKQELVVYADISTYSIHEVDALGFPAQFNNALSVVFDGFLPHEVTTPTYTLRYQDDSIVQGMTANFGPPSFEAGSQHADVAQRVVYPVHIRFSGVAAFNAIPANEDFQEIYFRAEAGLFSYQIPLQLSKNPNPRMSDGEPPWLSIDLRVFKTTPAQAVTSGIVHPAADEGESGAYGYIQDVLEAYNSLGEGNHPFDMLPTDQDINRLELGTLDQNGDPVFNYAIARVRFRAPEGIDAIGVRVFFRMWTTGWTALEFDTAASYRRHGNGSTATPLLGLRGGEINTVPCFAQARAANMEQQSDSTNRRTLNGAESTEVFGYFGCWLDVNQDVKRFPLRPQHNGPFTDTPDDDDLRLRSITELMRGLHHCLVAEIHYELDPIPVNATPGSSDNLAQRNILFDFSDNPGSFNEHLVHHTFELEPSPTPFPAPGVGASTSRISHLEELMIDWGQLPRDSLVTFYMPQVDAHEIERAAALRQSPPNLEAVNSNTVRCRVTDVGFIPIPGPLDQSIGGLVSIQLPPGVPYGKTYKVVLKQITYRNQMHYRVLGRTEFRIQVLNSEVLLPRFLQNIAVLKHIALSIPTNNRWYPIFQRYLGELGERVRALGGDPDSIQPSPLGYRPGLHKPEEGGGNKQVYAGKVLHLYYDCFGDFEGFELSDCDKGRRFVSQDRGVERVVLTACRYNLRLSVLYDPATQGPIRLTLQC